MVALLAAIAVAILWVAAESRHVVRIERVARLAFGPSGQPRRWARFAPLYRTAAAGFATWALLTLLVLPPKPHRDGDVPDREKRHLMLVVDISPSMYLEDAGPTKTESRRKRAAAVLQSFFSRMPLEAYKLSIVAVYNGAKPVVVDTKDMEVVRHLLAEVPMHYAFEKGSTNLLSGVSTGLEIAAPWQPKSTTLIVVSDGDSLPATGMPRLPASLANVLVVGVGDPQQGKFIGGRTSRQDVSHLQQLATRLGGEFHDANEKHVPSDLVNSITQLAGKSVLDQLTIREYALAAALLSGLVLAGLPWLLHRAGTAWRPGVRADRTRPGTSATPGPARAASDAQSPPQPRAAARSMTVGQG